MVAEGETDVDPESATAVPFSVAEVPLVLAQVSVELPPAVMLAGDAVSDAVGAGLVAAPTVTTVLAAVVPPAPVTERV